jgi:hypothetical protein
MFNKLNSDLNTKDNFIYELSTREVNGSPGAVGRGNDDGVPYGE